MSDQVQGGTEREEQGMLKVSSNSDPGSAAGAIANGIREFGESAIQVIGPRAVNQAVKAIAIARGYLAASGLDVYCVPSFANVWVAETDQEKTAIQFSVRTRHAVSANAPTAVDL